MGKTTTADKILMANPTDKEYEYTPAALNSDEDAAERGVSTAEDITMWHVSDSPEELERVTKRLKNLIFWRSLEKPHEEINNSRTKESKITERCELLSNDTSKIRVLDVPGFYGTDASTADDIQERVQQTTKCDLRAMRKILRIQNTQAFKFNRIIYFLPETGVLTRSSQILQTEIGIMKKYFDQSIFETMVAVATHNQSSYRFFPKDVDLYTEEDRETTRHRLKNALYKVFKNEDVEIPNVIFLSLFDTCEDILLKIKASKVKKEGVTLILSPSVCARCGIKIQMLERDGADMDGEDKRLFSQCVREEKNETVPYLESTCHPLLIPKHSVVERVAGGIAHIITLKRFKGRWPDFHSHDEVCGACRDPPNTRGCVHVGGDYKGIPVDHTSEVMEKYETA